MPSQALKTKAVVRLYSHLPRIRSSDLKPLIVLFLGMLILSTASLARASSMPPVVSYVEDEVHYRMVCDESRTAPFTQRETKAPCTMMPEAGVQFIKKNQKPCDVPGRGEKLRALIGSLCESIDNLKITDSMFTRTLVCASGTGQEVEQYIGRQQCLSTYRPILKCIPHTHKDGTVHSCDDR